MTELDLGIQVRTRMISAGLDSLFPVHRLGREIPYTFSQRISFVAQGVFRFLAGKMQERVCDPNPVLFSTTRFIFETPLGCMPVELSKLPIPEAGSTACQRDPRIGF
jgi:hypothetical protein